MSLGDPIGGHLDELREIVAEVLELEPEDIVDKADFVEEYGADSLRAIEILARIEKRYRVEIPQSALPDMQNLAAVYRQLAHHAGWDATEVVA
jgi:acyl carrier protein